MLVRGLFLSLLACLLPAWAQAQSPIPLFSTRVGTGFTNPVFGAPAPGDANNMYVVQQGGLIRVMNVNSGAINSTPFLDLPNVPGISFTSAGFEQGLLGLAFDPNYASNGRFYVHYTQANGTLTVDRFTTSGGVANPNSRQNIIQVPHPTFTNHNAGWIAFGPRDGYLYVTTGDGGAGDDPNQNAQNRNALLGKMLRLDVSGAGAGYAIPPTNPLVGVPNTRGEIWAYGLRNPWRNSFDAAGNLYIADVGQNAFEEINFQVFNSTGGQNYGWRAREGKSDNPNVPDAAPVPRVEPFYDYAHTPTGDPFTGFAIVGGYVYRGGDIQEGGGLSLDGTYFFADNSNGRIWSLRYSGTGALTTADVTVRTTQLGTAVGGGTINNPTSFAEDSFGRLYILDATGGEIFLIRGAAIPEPGAWALIGVALGVVGVVHWRRRKQALAAL
jgi:hypothetical protein